MNENRWKTHRLKKFKAAKQGRCLQMLTCYDYSTACALNQTELDLVLVGDSVGNVVLGLEDTIGVTLDHMVMFAQAVRRGCPDKYLVVDLPFGSYADEKVGVANAISVFQKTGADAIKVEGHTPHVISIIERLSQIGVPVFAHLGLTPQSLYYLGGHYTHGTNKQSKSFLFDKAKLIESSGAVAVVLECVHDQLTQTLTQELCIPTIGIGSGARSDGQVLVINDLLGDSPKRGPSFCCPEVFLWEEKKRAVHAYLEKQKKQFTPDLTGPHHGPLQ